MHPLSRKGPSPPAPAKNPERTPQDFERAFAVPCKGTSERPKGYLADPRAPPQTKFSGIPKGPKASQSAPFEIMKNAPPSKNALRRPQLPLEKLSYANTSHSTAWVSSHFREGYCGELQLNFGIGDARPGELRLNFGTGLAWPGEFPLNFGADAAASFVSMSGRATPGQAGFISLFGAAGDFRRNSGTDQSWPGELPQFRNVRHLAKRMSSRLRDG